MADFNIKGARNPLARKRPGQSYSSGPFHLLFFLSFFLISKAAEVVSLLLGKLCGLSETAGGGHLSKPLMAVSFLEKNVLFFS